MNISPIEQNQCAIILAAGMGSRLKEYTKHLPKCLLEINNRTLLENTLFSLSQSEVQKVVIVVGYKGNKIRECFGDSFGEMSIEYVENELYQSTNNIYSLYLGLNRLNSSAWVIESDIFFEPNFFKYITYNYPLRSISWLVDSSISQIDGCYVQSISNKINKVEIFRDLSLIPASYKKSVGILYIDEKKLNFVRTFINSYIQQNKLDSYYDLALADNLYFSDCPFYDIDINGLKWFEIDTPDDLKIARRLFL